MCGLHVIGGGVRIGSVVVVGIELAPGNVLLERCDRRGAGKLLTPAPNHIQSPAQYRRKRVNILVPGAVEVAEEQQIVITQVFSRLFRTYVRKLTPLDDYPAGKMY